MFTCNWKYNNRYGSFNLAKQAQGKILQFWSRTLLISVFTYFLRIKRTFQVNENSLFSFEWKCHSRFGIFDLAKPAKRRDCSIAKPYLNNLCYCYIVSIKSTVSVYGIRLFSCQWKYRNRYGLFDWHNGVSRQVFRIPYLI